MTEHNVLMDTTADDPMLRIDWIRTGTDIGVDVRVACGCRARMTVPVTDVLTIRNNGEALSALGLVLLVKAVRATDADHTLLARLRVEVELLSMLASQATAWGACVTTWLDAWRTRDAAR